MKKKKLLYLSQCFPLPSDGGGKIKTFNTLSTLAKKFEVFAVFVSERKADREGLKTFQELGINYKIFQTDIMNKNIKEDYLKLFWNYLQLRPHYVYQYRYLPSFSWIRKKISGWQPDIIHVDHINSAQFLPNQKWLRKNCRRPLLILENHNLDHRLFFTRFHETKKFVRKIYLLLEGSLNWLYGELNYPRFDHIFSISDSETSYLKKKYRSVSTQKLVYPLKKTVLSKSKKFDIIFIGYLEWPPNEVAVRWFAEKILPLISSQLPSVKFHVVGKTNPKLQDLKKDPRIIFYGYQKNLSKFLGSSKVFVLPFKTGAGIRIKSLTALQHGIPIVSTEMGVGGLHISPGREYLEANSAILFAQKVILLLKKPQLRDTMSRKQRDYFNSHHSRKENKFFLTEYLDLLNLVNQ